MATERELNNLIEEKAEQVRSELRRLEKRNLVEKTQIVRESFPNIFSDAEKFVTSTNYMPWEFGVAFGLGGELGELQKKYEVPHGRHRPYYHTVSPTTDMFCQASELVMKRIHVENQERWDLTHEIRDRSLGISEEELTQRVDEEMNKRQQEWDIM